MIKLSKYCWNILLILTVSFLFSFSKIAPHQFQTECVSQNIDGYIVFKIWNPSKCKSYKFKQAQKDGIYAVLFNGISGINGCQTSQPILNSEVEINKFKSIEKSFFAKNGEWTHYATNNMVEKVELKNKKMVRVFELSIVKDNLRKYLENNKIINNLNSGF
jgi:hypothetical protein